MGRSGRPETARQSYSIDAANEFESFVERMYSCCEKMNLDIDTLIHESGAAQLEVNFVHGDPLSIADQVFTFKRAVREIAFKEACMRPLWRSQWHQSQALQPTFIKVF